MTDINLGKPQPYMASEAHADQLMPPKLSGQRVLPPTPPEVDTEQVVAPVNPYAPTGWRRKERIEFDVTLPSGQTARLMRFERDDLLRLGLMEYLDTFTPILFDATLDDNMRDEKIRQMLQEKPEAITDMFVAIDKVVMAATLRPHVTDDKDKVNYGVQKDWDNPNFTATVHVDDIDMSERMYLFGAAFGRSMDELKSVWEQTESLGSVADEPGLQPQSQ
jgi:hypothetical protein